MKHVNPKPPAPTDYWMINDAEGNPIVPHLVISEDATGAHAAAMMFAKVKESAARDGGISVRRVMSDALERDYTWEAAGYRLKDVPQGER